MYPPSSSSTNPILALQSAPLFLIRFSPSPVKQKSAFPGSTFWRMAQESVINLLSLSPEGQKHLLPPTLATKRTTPFLINYDGQTLG